MMGLTHMVVSSMATALILGTSDPTLLLVGAISGLLPDVDISTSTAGRALPWVNHWLKQQFPHRSCTHSFAASCAVAAFTYDTAFLTNGKFLQLALQLASAISIGYFFGWFIDAFTKSGVEMFWPHRKRYGIPSNRNFRLRSGSPVEYRLLGLLVVLEILLFNINANGGVLTQFNRLLASPVGVEQVYKQSGSTHLITAHIKGVRSSDRAPVKGDFTIIRAKGQDFIVKSSTKRIYQAGLDSNSQIIIQQITADIGVPAITNIESLTLNGDDDLAYSLEKFNRPGPMVFVSGQLTIDDPEDVKYIPDPYQLPFIKLSASSLSLDTAPLSIVLSHFSEQCATGQLQLRIITTAST